MVKRKSKKKMEINRTEVVAIAAFLLLLTLSLMTQAIGTIDGPDYAAVSKFFAGELDSKIRSSHSYFYGFFHSPLIFLFESFNALKIVNLFYIALIILSLYFITNRNEKVLLLAVFSPVVWYMGPWINPLQISSLLFLWGYYFIKRYDREDNFLLLVVSGLFIGLSWIFWDAIIYFSIILGVSFLYDKKTYNFALYFLAVLLGLTPKLFVDQIMFGAFFVGILRYVFSTLVTLIWSGIYGGLNFYGYSILNVISVLLVVPYFIYKLWNKEYWKENKKIVMAITLSLILIIMNSQIRYLILIAPLIILEVAPKLSKKEFKIYLIISIVLSLVVTIPYLIQINNTTNADEFSTLVRNIGDVEIKDSENRLIREDLIEIENDFAGKSFIVGNHPDDYIRLSMLYWGDGIDEFVSIQDYNLYIKGEEILFEKYYQPKSSINNRRELFIGGGIAKKYGDETDYDSMDYAISVRSDRIDVGNFTLVKEYQILRVYEKSI
jgi:hypothetical protein